MILNLKIVSDTKLVFLQWLVQSESFDFYIFIFKLNWLDRKWKYDGMDNGEGWDGNNVLLWGIKKGNQVRWIF